MSHLPRVDGVVDSLKYFDLDTMTLTYDLDPLDLDLGKYIEIRNVAF